MPSTEADFSPEEQKKILRALARLRHSILADREIKERLDEQAKAMTAGTTLRFDGDLKTLLDL